MNVPLEADLVVLGAGIIGLSVAEEAAHRGMRTVVVEPRHVSAGAAGVAAGMLAPASEAETEDQSLVDFAINSCQRYPAWVERLQRETGIDCGLRSEGTLLVALDRDHAEEVHHIAAIQSRLRFTVEWLAADEVLRREPNLAPRVVGGAYLRDDHQVDPRRLLRALAERFKASGGTLIEGTAAESVDVVDGAVRAVTLAGGGIDACIHTPAVVLAAGAWICDVLPDGYPMLPSRPVRGQILRLRGGPLVDHVVRTPDVYLVPRWDGEIVVGATMEERGFDTRTTAGAVHDLLRHAWRAVPGIAELELAETGVGFRPALRDNLPAIGAFGPGGCYVATGHYRHGVMLAPATAALLLDVIEGRPAPALLEPFAPSRFGTPSTNRKEPAIAHPRQR